MHLPTNLPGIRDMSVLFAPSILPVSGGPLAGGTPVGRAVHEGFTTQGGAAPITGCSLSPIGVQGVGKVAGLAVHVDVLAVKTCPTLDECFLQHSSDLCEEQANLGRTEATREG